MKAPYIVIVVLLAIIVLLFFDKSQNDNRLNELERKTKLKLDSVRAHYRELILEDSITFVHYQKAKQEAIRYRSEATAWQQKYEREKNKPAVRYDDQQLDSLLSAIR